MTTPYSGASHSRRRCSTSGASTIVLAVSAFLFTAWMLAHGHSPVAAVSTTSAVLVVTTTLSRSRLLGARFGSLPSNGTVVLLQDNEQ